MTNSFVSGEIRRVYVTLGAVAGDAPAPVGDAFQRIIAVEEVCPPGAVYTPPPLEWLTLFGTLHGHAMTHIGAHTLTHQAGSLIAVASGSQIIEHVDARLPWRVRYLLLTGSWADQMDDWLRRKEPCAAIEASAARNGRLLCEMVDLALTQEDGWRWVFVSRCAELWGALYSDRSDALGASLLTQVGLILDEAPAERLTVAQIAARVHLTPRQLIYRFQNAAGEPLAQWTRRRRVAAARRLLSQGYSVTTVAERLGFANPYHFSRAFKAVTGATPSHVREDALRGSLHACASELDSGRSDVTSEQ